MRLPRGIYWETFYGFVVGTAAVIVVVWLFAAMVIGSLDILQKIGAIFL